MVKRELSESEIKAMIDKAIRDHALEVARIKAMVDVAIARHTGEPVDAAGMLFDRLVEAGIINPAQTDGTKARELRIPGTKIM